MKILSWDLQLIFFLSDLLIKLLKNWLFKKSYADFKEVLCRNLPINRHVNASVNGWWWCLQYEVHRSWMLTNSDIQVQNWSTSLQFSHAEAAASTTIFRYFCILLTCCNFLYLLYLSCLFKSESYCCDWLLIIYCVFIDWLTHADKWNWIKKERTWNFASWHVFFS